MLLHKFKQHFFARFGHSLLVMLVSSWIMLGNADPSAAQPPRTVTWQDLQPEQTLNFQTALGHLSREQLGDLATLARIRWWLEEGQISPDSSDAVMGKRLEQTLTQQGLDVEQLILLAYQVQAQTNQTTNLAGKQIKISGYVLPLNQTEQNEISQLLLVPFVGACIHVPPPPPNQIIYIKPSTPIENPGLFTRVWVEGTLRQQSASYDLFLMDGSRPIQASYAMTLESIAIGSRQPSKKQLTDSTPLSQGYSWWQALQVRGANLFTQQMNLIQQGNSPAALLLGVLVAFGYGVLHTLGPGHGKAVILSYFVGHGGSLRRGITMGARIAIFHVMSAVGIVILTDLVIRQTIGSAPANYRLVRLVSYGAISLIGGWMLRQALKSPRQHSPALISQALEPELLMVNRFSDRILGQAPLPTIPQLPQNPCRCLSCYGRPEAAGWLSLAVGAVPCSGAILIMLYGLANNMIGPAVLMVLGISLGMAITLSAIGVAVLVGRNYMSRRVEPTSQIHASLFRALNIAGASGILLVGLLLFLSSLQN
jgi:nickel/cobalt exporter